MRDPHRPSYHFASPSDWMNDPNGLIQWDGRYHLFYQYWPGMLTDALPPGLKEARAHWAHAASDDLVHWEHLPIALAPKPGGGDQDGCASGCMVDHNGVPTAVYTGFHPQVQCIARGSADLVTWTKHPGNPVISGPPPGLDVTGFRDTCVWYEADGWRLVVGCGIRGEGGMLPLYRSPDLVEWEYLGPMFAGDAVVADAMWVVPDLIPADDQHVLMLTTSPGSMLIHYVGRYGDGRFDGELRGDVDFGAHFFAPQSMQDDRGRCLMWGWLVEGRSTAAQRQAGWSGMMSLPRVVDLDAAGRLRMVPPSELTALRGEFHEFGGADLPFGRTHVIEGVAGAALEIEAEFEPIESGTVGLSVLRSRDGREATHITYNYFVDRLTLECGESSLDLATARTTTGGPLRLGRNEPVRLRVYLDGSAVEVFANGRAAASRVYPSQPDSQGIAVFSREPRESDLIRPSHTARLTSLRVWEMKPIWDGTEVIPASP